jgi:hypothetical protein
MRHDVWKNDAKADRFRVQVLEKFAGSSFHQKNLRKFVAMTVYFSPEVEKLSNIGYPFFECLVSHIVQYRDPIATWSKIPPKRKGSPQSRPLPHFQDLHRLCAVWGHGVDLGRLHLVVLQGLDELSACQRVGQG